MMVLVEFVVAVSASLTATAALFGVRYARRASARSQRALNLLEGVNGSDGLVAKVEANRRALLHAGLYPPAMTDGGDSDG